MRRTLRSLLRDQAGTVGPYVAFLSPLLFGAGLLAIDVGRVTVTHDQLQYAADAAALAGARELDGQSGAIDRARRAAAAVLNRQDFGKTPGAVWPTGTTILPLCGGDVAAGCARILRSLPAEDTDPITGGDTTLDAEARFIQVVVPRTDVEAIFFDVLPRAEPAAPGDPGGTASPGASAVAGNDPLICGVPPLVMCRPTDPDALGRGKAVEVFMQPAGAGGGASYIPGQFGLLCPADDSVNCGASSIGENIASVDGTCVASRSMSMKPGVSLQQVRTGINARFDWWSPQAKDALGDWRRQARYVPARNVTQATEPQGSPLSGTTKCERSDLSAATAAALPSDTCLVSGTCPNGRFGDGVWDRTRYFDVNHGGSDGVLAGFSGQIPGGTASAIRFEVYRAEIEAGRIVQPGQSIGGGGTTSEDGDPQCFQEGTALATPDYTWFDGAPANDLRLLRDRRVLPVVVADCSDPVFDPRDFTPDDIRFMFIVQPMYTPAGATIVLEDLGPMADGVLDDMFKDVVQIYRR